MFCCPLFLYFSLNLNSNHILLSPFVLNLERHAKEIRDNVSKKQRIHFSKRQKAEQCSVLSHKQKLSPLLTFDLSCSSGISVKYPLVISNDNVPQVTLHCLYGKSSHSVWLSPLTKSKYMHMIFKEKFLFLNNLFSACNNLFLNTLLQR